MLAAPILDSIHGRRPSNARRGLHVPHVLRSWTRAPRLSRGNARSAARCSIDQPNAHCRPAANRRGRATFLYAQARHDPLVKNLPNRAFKNIKVAPIKRGRSTLYKERGSRTNTRQPYVTAPETTNKLLNYWLTMMRHAC
jgi:hypothetical protein